MEYSALALIGETQLFGRITATNIVDCASDSRFLMKQEEQFSTWATDCAYRSASNSMTRQHGFTRNTKIGLMNKKFDAARR